MSDATFIDLDGNAYPITNWFDDDGDECAPDDAVTAVAGAGDRWFAFRLDEMERPVLSWLQNKDQTP